MLTLPIKKKWFDMILSGEKKEEYREHNDYYQSRLWKYRESLGLNVPVEQPSEPFYIRFRNGYKKDSPTVECLVCVSLNEGNPDWGAKPNKLYLVLTILDVKRIV